MKRILLLGFFGGCVATSQAQFKLLKKQKQETQQPSIADSISASQNNEPEEHKKKGGGLFQKAIGKIAKIAGNTVAGGSGMVATVENLQEVDIVAGVGTNIYSKDLGLMITDFLGKDWINNGDFTMLQLTSKNGFQMYKYGGTIKVNGKELKHSSLGVHTVTENPNSGIKKIVFEKNGTVEGSFDIPTPSKNIKLVSINGQNKNIKVDFTKDVVLELANYTTNTESLIRVDVVATTIGLRSLYLVAYIKPAAKVAIPAAAFRNIENQNANFNFKNCYLTVADQLLVPVQNRTGVFAQPFNAVVGSNDGMWIDVTASNDNNKGIKIGDDVVKQNAAFAMPLSYAKIIAVSSFFTNGTTYLYDEKTNNWLKSTSTKELQFPQIPDALLDNYLTEMYKKFTATLNEVNGSIILPVSTTPNAPSYENTIKFFKEETNNESEFLKVYKGLSPMQSLTSVSMRLQGENALLAEAKADALFKVKLICQLSWDDKPKMTPYLTIELVGASNGGFRSYMGNTKYFTFNIKGDGYELKKNKPIEYDRIFQVDKLNEIFKNNLTELKKKEAEIGDYEMVWGIQK